MTTTTTIVVDNDVILDGEGNLILDGNQTHRVVRGRPQLGFRLRENLLRPPRETIDG